MQDPGGAIALQEASFRFVSKPKIGEVLDSLHWAEVCSAAAVLFRFTSVSTLNSSLP